MPVDEAVSRKILGRYRKDLEELKALTKRYRDIQVRIYALISNLTLPYLIVLGSVPFYQGKIRANIIALKLGEKGCLLFDGEELIREYGIAVDVVDPSGAGDAFNAGVIYGVMRGLDLKKTARLANIVGALSTTRLGAGQNLPTKEEIIEFLKKSSEKELLQLFERGC